MGFLDLIKGQTTTSVPSILPDAAKQQIMQGQLPLLQPRNLMLKKGEVCHYVDRAIYEKRTITKKRIQKGRGYSMPGFSKGTRINIGGGSSEYVDDERFETIKGMLYITDKRIIFVGGNNGFDKKVDDLVAVMPYTNGIELQFSKETVKLFVPDDSIAYAVLKLI